jgi:hypothetical protein
MQAPPPVFRDPASKASIGAATSSADDVSEVSTGANPQHGLPEHAAAATSRAKPSANRPSTSQSSPQTQDSESFNSQASTSSRVVGAAAGTGLSTTAARQSAMAAAMAAVQFAAPGNRERVMNEAMAAALDPSSVQAEVVQSKANEERTHTSAFAPIPTMPLASDTPCLAALFTARAP